MAETPIENLRKKLNKRANWSSSIATILILLMVLLAFLVSSKTYGQSAIFTVQGVSRGPAPTSVERIQTLLDDISYFNDSNASSMKIRSKRTDSVYFIQVVPETAPFVEGYKTIRIPGAKLDSIITSFKNGIIQNKAKQVPAEKDSSLIIPMLLKKIPLGALIVLILLNAAAIRYFILLSIHLRSRSNALSLIDPTEKITAENAIALTSSSHIDFRISKNLKSEFLIQKNAKNQETKGANNWCCCHCCGEKKAEN